MKPIIIYKGKYGATEQYANWLAGELRILEVPADDAPENILVDYDTVIIGTSVYIGKLQIQPWIEKNHLALLKKKLFLFLVAGTPPDQKEKLNSYIKAGIPEDLRKQCTIFYLHGRLEFGKLSLKHKILLKMGAWLSKGKGADEIKIKDYDDVRKENLYPLIHAVKKEATGIKETVKLS